MTGLMFIVYPVLSVEVSRRSLFCSAEYATVARLRDQVLFYALCDKCLLICVGIWQCQNQKILEDIP